MADFDVEGARRAGYSEAEIVDHLAQSRRFDAAGARRSGYSDAEILGHLRTPLAPAGGNAPKAPGALRTALRGAAQGATFGFADEARGAVAGVGGLFSGEGFGPAYERGRDEARALDTAGATAHPVANVAGNLGGAVGGALLMAPVAGAVGLTALGSRAAALGGRLAAPIAGRVNALMQSVVPNHLQAMGRAFSSSGPVQAVTNTIGAAGRGVVAGTAGGAVAGFGEGQGGLGARLENAGEGAALGGVVGGAVGAGVRVGAGLAGRVGHALNLRNPEVAADRQILRSLDRGNVTLDQVDQRLAAAGNDPVALVDAGSRNTVNLGATAANTPSEAMDVADAFVQGRRRSRPDRLMNAGDQAFGGGSGADIATTEAARDAQRRAAAGPLYDQVRAFGPVDNPAITDRLLRLPDNVFTRASTFARLDGVDPAPLVQGGKLTRVPTAADLDLVGQGLGDSIEAARRAGDNALARQLTIARNELVGLADDAIVDPGTGQRIYADARAAYAGPSAQMEATEAGRTAFRTDRDTVAATMQGSAPDVQDAYRLGAGRNFSDQVSDPQAAPGFVRDLLEDHTQQARLNALLQPTQRDGLNSVLRRENDMVAVERAVSPRAGSQTGRLAAGGDDMGNDPAGPWVTALAQLTSGHPVAASGTLVRDQWRRLGQGINPATSDALANRLFATDPAARQAMLTALRQRQDNDLIAAARARAIGRPILQGVGATSGLAAD